MDQPEGSADQNNDHSTDHEFGHRLREFDRIEGVAIGFLDGETRANRENAPCDANARDNKKGNQIRNTDIVGGGDEKPGNGSENFHDNKNEKDFVNDRNEGRKKGQVVKHRVQNVMDEIDGDCARDDQEKEGDVAVSDDFPFCDEAEETGT